MESISCGSFSTNASLHQWAYLFSLSTTSYYFWQMQQGHGRLKRPAFQIIIAQSILCLNYTVENIILLQADDLQAISVHILILLLVLDICFWCDVLKKYAPRQCQKQYEIYYNIIQAQSGMQSGCIFIRPSHPNPVFQHKFLHSQLFLKIHICLAKIIWKPFSAVEMQL